MARAVGISHVALEVGSLDEALAFFGLVVDDEEEAVLAAARDAGAQIFGGNSFLDPWGNHVQGVQGVQDDEIQFTKAPEILRGMGLALGKSESALRELRHKGLLS